MKINKINVIIFITMFVNVFLAFPLILISIFKKKESPFLIGLFFGVLGFYFVPSSERYDLYRYFAAFEAGRDNILTFLSYQNDLYARTLMIGAFNLGLPQNILPALSAFISYYFIFKSLKISLEYNKIEGKKRILSFLFCFLVIPFSDFTGIRYLPAISIFLYSIILKEIKKSKKWIIYFFIAPLIHSFIWINVMLFFLMFKLKEKTLKWLFVISFILGIIFEYNISILYKIIKIINSFGLITIKEIYVNGIWGKDYFEGLNKNWFIIEKSKILLEQLILYYYFIFFIIKKHSWKNIEVLSLYLVLIKFMRTVFLRNFKLFSLAIFIKEIRGDTLKKKILYMIIAIYASWNFFLQIYTHWQSLILSYSNFYTLSLLKIVLRLIE